MATRIVSLIIIATRKGSAPALASPRLCVSEHVCLLVDFGGMPFTMNYAGVVRGDSIQFTIDVFGVPLELTVN